MTSRRMVMAFKAQARRQRIFAGYVRGSQFQTAARSAESYKRLYDEAESSNTEALKKLAEIGRTVDDFL